MASSLPGYDAWLSRPYEDAAIEAERYWDFCEEHGLDPDDPDSESLYSDYLDLYDEPDYDEPDEGDLEYDD